MGFFFGTTLKAGTVNFLFPDKALIVVKVSSYVNIVCRLKVAKTRKKVKQELAFAIFVSVFFPLIK